MRLIDKKNLIVLVISFIFCIIFLEIILRIAFISSHENPNTVLFQKSNNAKLIYELAPNVNITRENITIYTNTIGIRDFEEINTSKRPIIILGDSVALGLNIEQYQTYAQILEKSMKNEDVYNFGVDGYGIEQYIEVLQTKALQYNPKMVIISYVFNDPLISPFPAEYFQEKDDSPCVIRSFQLKVNCKFKNMIDEIQLISFTLSRWNNIRYKVDMDYWQQLHTNPKTYQHTQIGLSKFKNLSYDYNFTPVVVVFPILHFEDYRWNNIHQQISSDAKLNNITLIDLYDPFSELNTTLLKHTPNDLIHPSIFGHHVAGTYIAKQLLTMNLTS